MTRNDIRLLARLVMPAFACLLIGARAARPDVPDDYWQQEVNYRMEVSLGQDGRTISGKIEIEYVNNCPDTLDVIYLKAFPNAIQKGSYADHKQRRQNEYSLANLKPGQAGSLRLQELERGDSFCSRVSNHRFFTFDNSIIEVQLTQPLAPSDTTWLVFGFTTTLPRPARMRMGPVQGVTRAAYWYPQACVYDRTAGWVNSQYLGWGECYGDYGSFDVTITAPADQIVAATGVCTNENEVLPPDLRRKLDIANFRKPRSEWPEFESDADAAKNWHYVADNVNDFVFSTSANWCIDSDTINGVEVVAYPLRHKAEQWKDAVLYGKQSIETFSELFLPYQWPVIRICDAFSGMEYPMLTNCGGGGPSPYFPLLLYHEIGHQWFMGQIGSNAVDRPFLDEGFTTHAEHVAMEKYLGIEGNLNHPTNWYERTFGPPLTDRNVRGFRPLFLLMQQELDQPMVFAYDRGKEYWPWRVSAYYKTAAMHYSLRAILGDSAYFQFMRHYCRTWLFKHPYEDDFRRALDESTGLHWSEYLRQWYHGRQRLDYAFDGRSTSHSGDGYVHTIKLKRVGDFITPVDVAVVWQQGDTALFTVPIDGIEYAKPGYQLMPVWRQMRTREDRYEFTITAGQKIRKVIVDPREMLMDIDRRNNVSGFPGPIELRFDNLVYDRTPVSAYALRWRPDLWYDEPNGLEIGGHLHGSFLEYHDRFSLDARVGTESGNPSVDFSWSSLFEPFGANSTAGGRLLWTDERFFLRSKYEKRFGTWYSRPDHELLRIELDISSAKNTTDNRLDPLPSSLVKYLPRSSLWFPTFAQYVRISHGLWRTFRYGSWYYYNRESIGTFEEDDRYRGFLESQWLTGIAFGDANRYWLSLRGEWLSTSGEPAPQYLNHLSRVRAIDRYASSRVFRTPGTFPSDWENGFYLANRRVRGYEDRPIYLTDFRGGSIEITPPDILPYRWLDKIPLLGRTLSRVNNTFFVDGGQMWMDSEWHYGEPIYSGGMKTYDYDEKVVMSAGVSLTMPPFWRDQTLRVDFPVYLNEPAPGGDNFEFRFAVAWLLPWDMLWP